MKFPYISIMPLIDEAMSMVKKISKTTDYNDGDAYVNAVDCAREIGFNNYESASTEIEIKGHNGFIPQDFYLIDEIWRCKPNPLYAHVPVTPNPNPHNIRWIRTDIMRPMDADTRRRMNAKHSCPQMEEATAFFKIKIPPGSIRVSFLEGTISMDYLKIPTENGVVLVQDEINGIKCIKAYIIMMMLYESWLLGEVRGDVWGSLKDDYETHLKIAQMIQKAPDMADTAAKAIEQDQRYRNMRYLYQ